MNPPLAAQARDARPRTAPPTERRFSPAVYALDRLFPNRGNAPYSSAERLVVLVIVRATSLDEQSGDFNCFLSYPTIAKRAGISVAPAPLLCRSMAGQTRGYHHLCYRFTLVRHPEQFASARNAARAAHAEQVDRAMRDLQPDRIALQRQLEDFGGTLTDAEYQQRLAALERAARCKRRARAALKQPPPV
jgi:hypothetical protein